MLYNWRIGGEGGGVGSVPVNWGWACREFLLYKQIAKLKFVHKKEKKKKDFYNTDNFFLFSIFKFLFASLNEENFHQQGLCAIFNG